MRQISQAILVAACSAAFAQTVLASDAVQNSATQYRVTNLPSLGGSVSRANSIDDLGIISGYSNQAGNQSRHATAWLFGSAFDLGTLGGPNSSVAWPVKNNIGVLSGISQTATPDPLGEAWSCSAFFPGATSTGFTCVGFFADMTGMHALPTLGGNNGFATGTNNFGQTVGWAENTVHDPTCTPPQVLQFRAVSWDAFTHHAHELAPLPGDTSGAATAINDRGQIVGISGICDEAVGRLTAEHAVLWENGHVTNIGNLGGHAWNTPMAINQRGDVVGFSDLANDDPDNSNAHAFLWTRHDGIRDLGTLSGDVYSEAHAINELRQVVGISCDVDGNCRAFVWQNGVMTDLNTLVAPGYTDQLTNGQDINDFGTIVGRALDPNTGERPAFVAFPSHGHDAALMGGDGSDDMGR